MSTSTAQSPQLEPPVPSSFTPAVNFATIAAELGREIRVFRVSPDSANSVETSATSTSQNDEPDDYYDLTAEDYYHLIGDKLGVQFLKTRKIREAEAAARRAKITKAVIKVRFPDGYVLEVKFHPSETIQCLIDLLKKVVACQDLPFYIYTTPPKQKVKDMSKDFYSSGFAPGAIVYFSYDISEGTANAPDTGPFLREDIMSLKDINDSSLRQKSIGPATDKAPLVTAETAPVDPEPNPANKMVTKAKPKWFKMQ